MAKVSGTLLVCVVMAFLVGCGGGTPAPTPTPTPIATPTPAATVNPASAAVPIGTTKQFTTTGFAGTVTWSINPAVGTIDPNGLYHAPATFPSPNAFTVTATSGTTTAMANASVVFPNDNASAESAPVKLGSSGANALDVVATVCCIGTLGSLWIRGTGTFILSNNHVLARSGQGVAGEAIDQPGQTQCFGSIITVANLTAQAALVPAGTAQGRTGPAPSNVDAAIAQVVAGMVDPAGTILDLGAEGTTTIAAAPPSATLATPAIGMNVAKSGRTTGLTCSSITSVNTSVQVAYETACGSNTTAFNATFTGQVVIAGGNFSAGGDSGSLIVTTAQARPVALLYGGSTTDTVANPIQDVIAALTSGPNVPAPVGGADHAVSCAPTASAGTQQAGTLSATVPLSAQQRARVAAVQGRAAMLLKDPAVHSVTIGSSADSPNEGAIMIRASRSLNTPIPAVIDGVRTRIVFDDAAAQPTIGQMQVDRATAVKEAHVAEFMGQPGIQGVGVSVSVDNPAETAISVYVIQGVAHPPIPAVIDGVRTRIFAGSRFRAY
jgi:hypothetical protein